MSTTQPLRYTLASTSRIPWNEAQEDAISKDFPFYPTPEELPDDYAIRTYLEFLWLPESIMDLKMLPLRLQRVQPATATSSEETIHPLHAILDVFLLTARSVTSKYHTDLNHLLVQGGSPEADQEPEEAMMWYSMTHEPLDDTIPEEPWKDSKWKTGWLDRMERRELCIQILLYFIKLSLPGPKPIPPASPSKKRTKAGDRPAPPAPSTEARLEALMDKLSMWQLVGNIQPDLSYTSTHTISGKRDERDWMQKFCENVVEYRFKDTLPDLCALLHSKVFPSSPFSDDDNDDNDASSEFENLEQENRLSEIPAPAPISAPAEDKVNQLKRARSASRALLEQHRAPKPKPKPTLSIQPKDLSETRRPSPSPNSASSATARIPPPSNVRKTSTSSSLSRSRSLSVSLAEEKRSRSVSIGPQRSALTREVSMSRSFKPGASQAKAKDKDEASSGVGAAGKKRKEEEEAKKLALKRAQSQAKFGMTLVEETPVKTRVIAGAGKAPLVMDGGIRIGAFPVHGKRKKELDEENEEEDWSLYSSPVSVLVGPGSPDGAVRNGDVLALETPVKKKSRKR
ncbi:hypothetical protein DL96DRAFT_1681104 [Flagelloscypha sp. PMI_526]|nr:hypothetical protein DL96DRAFT_1681104 [Flagelloscypha sp. PMI_526]